MSEEPTDTELRSWALAHAIESSKRGSRTTFLIERAEEFYGFMTRTEAEVTEIKNGRSPSEKPEEKGG